MAVLDINRTPSLRDLRWFGGLLPVFVAVFGGVVWWRTGSLAVATGVWAVGAAVSTAFAVWPAGRRPIYVAWMHAVYPIGWVVAHLLLGTIYFGVITPIGLGLRVLGREPLPRRFDRDARTYWVRRDPNLPVDRYLRQF